MFEVEYLNGEINGTGKEYYKDGTLKFEGQYLNGKKWNGKGYNKDGKLEFELINGNGKIQFDGVYSNEEKNRKGKIYNDKKVN